MGPGSCPADGSPVTQTTGTASSQVQTGETLQIPQRFQWENSELAGKTHPRLASTSAALCERPHLPSRNLHGRENLEAKSGGGEGVAGQGARKVHSEQLAGAQGPLVARERLVETAFRQCSLCCPGENTHTSTGGCVQASPTCPSTHATLFRHALFRHVPWMNLENVVLGEGSQMPRAMHHDSVHGRRLQRQIQRQGAGEQRPGAGEGRRVRGAGAAAARGRVSLGSAQVGTRCPHSAEKLSAPKLYTFEGLILLCLFNSLTPTKANYKRTTHAVPRRPCAQ